MPQIDNVNVGVGQQTLVDAGQAGARQVGEAQRLAPGTRLPSIRSGTLVDGQVLAQEDDGTYLVRVAVQGGARELRARATLPLIVGERFRAVWDASSNDGVPVLRLSKGELSFLSQIPQRDRELATALLSRGLPLSNEVMLAVKEAWRRTGSQEDRLAPLIELWARGVPMTSENASLIAEYTALSGAEATALWDRIRKELRARARKGEDPVAVLRTLKEGNGAVARFLQAHSILMRAPREDVDPALLAAPRWPMPEGAGDMMARVFVGRSAEDEGRRYWQVGFGLEGHALGTIGGLVESDGRGCNLDLRAEREEARALFEERRGELRAELEGGALPVLSIGISHRTVEALRDRLLAGRGLDVTV